MGIPVFVFKEDTPLPMLLTWLKKHSPYDRYTSVLYDREMVPYIGISHTAKTPHGAVKRHKGIVKIHDAYRSDAVKSLIKLNKTRSTRNGR